MRFVDRQDEIERLQRLMNRAEAALVVVYGRRRIGKTRLLLEWSSRADGLYTVADQSVAEVQRRYFAGAVSARLSGFADVDYPDWASLLTRLARDAEGDGWRGPLIIDELPGATGGPVRRIREEESSESYRIDDPFFRLWFRLVAPHRGELAASSRSARLALLRRHWPGLATDAWEELCRPRSGKGNDLAGFGPWAPASRWWRGNEPEWDVVSRSLDDETILLGEVKWRARPFRARDLEKAASELLARAAPSTPSLSAQSRVVRAFFVPTLDREAEALAAARSDVVIVTARQILA